MPAAIFVPASLNDLSVDVNVGSPARGAVFYRGAIQWGALAAGTAGQVLTSGGAGADPVWATLPVTLSGDVVLAPGSSTRNVIQPTGDFNALRVRRNAAGTTLAPQTWEDESGNALLQVTAKGRLLAGTPLLTPFFPPVLGIENDARVTNEYTLYHFNGSIPTSNSYWKGLALSIGSGAQKGLGFVELSAIDETGLPISVFQVQRIAAAFANVRFMSSNLVMASNSGTLQMTRTDTGTLTALQITASNDLVLGVPYTNATAMNVRLRLDSSSGALILDHTGGQTEVARITGTATMSFTRLSSNATPRSVTNMVSDFAVATDASFVGRGQLFASDFRGVDREAMRWETDGGNPSVPRVGFLGAAAVSRQSLAAAATDAATTLALANSLRSALIALGLGA